MSMDGAIAAEDQNGVSIGGSGRHADGPIYR
jgi:hypothetical protein